MPPLYFYSPYNPAHPNCVARGGLQFVQPRFFLGFGGKAGQSISAGLCESHNQSGPWPHRLDRILPMILNALLKEGFSTCSNIAALLPTELPELNPEMDISIAFMVRVGAYRFELQ